MKFCILFISFVILINLSEVLSHGRLDEPPARGTAWRHGFNTPRDYTDMEEFCGGKQNQYERQGGKCGVCGDPYQGPRDNECPNGMYCKKVIVRTYSVGQVIDVKVLLTANHNGYFVFRVCPVTDESREVSQECLNRHELVVEGTNNPKFEIPRGKTGYISTRVKLPNGLSCKRCVFQWDYRAANDYNQCPDGSYKVGCGNQETFRGCADIKIGSGNGNENRNENRNGNTATIRTPIPLRPINRNKNGCKSANDPRFDLWCEQNCAVHYCPPTYCKCN